MSRWTRAFIVLHETFRRRPFRDRVHILIRFLTCPFLPVVDAVAGSRSLLDVGAGHGLFARLALANGVSSVVAVEPDARKVRPLPGVSFVIAFDDAVRGRFDAVSIVDVLYKIPPAAWDALFDRAAERLGSGGLLVVKEQDPTNRIKNAWNRAQEWLASRLGLTLGEAFTYDSPAAFTARLQRHGFADVRVRRIDAWYPHPHILYVARRR